MTEDKLEEIAQPILDTLFEMQEELDPSKMDHPPVIHLISDAEEGHFADECADEVTQEFLLQLEAYIQEQLNEWYKPTILH